ncbi:hypothetical protein BHK98_09525 [Hornefia porci]|uniref:Uncharacterized protein n=1 Tax=Hornefia porci TaxID=2652292 RepID=A0A1Q9JJE5_9FIRM|nr:hypothetical protein BHK98_09525 [Hornefia porci]
MNGSRAAAKTDADGRGCAAGMNKGISGHYTKKTAIMSEQKYSGMVVFLSLSSAESVRSTHFMPLSRDSIA